MNTSVNLPHTQDGIAILRKYDQDVEAVPRVDQAYLSTLRGEFDSMSSELMRLREVLSDKSKAVSFISTYLEKF